MIDINKLEKQYIYKLKSLPRGNNEEINYVCNYPYKNITIDLNSNCFICNCDGWLPIPVGKVQDFNSIYDLMNSPIAKELQNDVNSKKFTYCATDTCGIKSQDMLSNILELQINIDDSCNLSCASCRRNLKMIKQGLEFQKKLKDIDRIMEWLSKFDEKIKITMSGNGDPLASNIIRPLIKNYKPKPNQIFRIFTNGLLIKKHLANTEIFKKTKNLDISVDAGSKKVYEEIRKPGKWKTLIENLNFLSDYNCKVTLNFALQKRNVEDIYNFVELVERYKFNGIIHELDDWGTWNYEPIKNPDQWTILNGTYIEHNVILPNNSLRNRAIEILDNVQSDRIFLSPKLKSIIKDTVL